MPEPIDGPVLTGEVQTVIIAEHSATPNRVIDDDGAFDIRVNWNLATPAAAALLDGGTWIVKAFVESVGPGPETLLRQVQVPATGAVAYNVSIHVQANTLPADVPPNAGLYSPAVVITYRTSSGKLTEVAGFSTGPTFLIRHP